MQLSVATTIHDLQTALTSASRAGKRVGFVPTMGALHQGHLELVREAKKKSDYVVVSIFVNPTQFGANEDFGQYPRTMEADLELLRGEGVDLAYTPSSEDIYPPGFSTTVSVGALGKILCGKFRPGHFDGVATVVAKLLLRVLPHEAFFGEKDYQQLCVIRRLVFDLDIPIRISGVPTVREADGLAMSSRNRYLSPSDRALAPKLYAQLKETAEQIKSGGDIQALLLAAGAKLTAAGFAVDYVELRHADMLDALSSLETPARLLAAVRLGSTRLIDNIAIE